MQVTLTPAQETMVRDAVRTGRLRNPDEVVREALALWEERERARAELLDSLDAADAALDSGEGVAVTRASVRAVAEDVKRRGRERLAAERPASG